MFFFIPVTKSDMWCCDKSWRLSVLPLQRNEKFTLSSPVQTINFSFNSQGVAFNWTINLHLIALYIECLLSNSPVSSTQISFKMLGTVIYWLLTFLIGAITAAIIYARWNYGTLEKVKGLPAVIKPSFIGGSDPFIHKKIVCDDDTRNVQKYGKIFGVSVLNS